MAYSEMRTQLLTTPLNRFRVQEMNLSMPLQEVVGKLNKFNPSILATYPTTLQTLLPEIREGRLKIRPNILKVGGETLGDAVMEEAGRLLHCTILNTYASSEGGMMAFVCKEGHTHINSDWLIIEAVDENNCKVPSGVQSAKILITNLSNHIQPFIRYEMTDRVTLYDQPCNCGSPYPYLKVEGRTDDLLEFNGAQGSFKLSPRTLLGPSMFQGIIHFQLVQKTRERIEVRFSCQEGADREALFRKIKGEILAELEGHQIQDVRVELSSELPQADPRSGKMKMVIKCFVCEK